MYHVLLKTALAVAAIWEMALFATVALLLLITVAVASG
jgi:hypothetical protein